MKPISPSCLPAFTWQADIQYLSIPPWLGVALGVALKAIEGPLLTHLKDSNGDSYLAYWRGRYESSHRWLLAKTSEKQIQQLLEGECSIDSCKCVYRRYSWQDCDWSLDRIFRFSSQVPAKTEC